MTTVTYVGAGAAVTGNNASLIPPLPSGLVSGDLMMIAASIRNSGTGTVNAPIGWTKMLESGNVCILGRFYVSGDTAPTVTFAGGVANADTIARMVAFRGVASDQLVPISSRVQLNGSAQNIDLGFIESDIGSGGLMVAWKQDDATAYTTPSPFTAIGLTSTTTGDDASMALYQYVQAAGISFGDVDPGSITVTGGAAAISRFLHVDLKHGPDVTVTEQDVYPPRVLISVTGLTLGDDVTIYRSVGGQRTMVRGASATSVADPSFVRTDAELPFGVPVSYVVVVRSLAEYTTAPVTYTLPGGKAVASDAVTGLAAEITIKAWDEKSYDRNSSVFKVGGRNVVVSGEMGMFEAAIEIFFEAYSSTENFFDLVSNSTEGIIQLRSPDPKYDGVDCYVAVLSASQRRFSQDGSDPRRTWVIQVAEVEPWVSSLEASGFTYQDVANTYGTTGTYANLAADYGTYLAVAQGDFS
jgi:hypothetical protein